MIIKLIDDGFVKALSYAVVIVYISKFAACSSHGMCHITFIYVT